MEYPGKGLPFYINCVKAKLESKLSRSHGAKNTNSLFKAWTSATSHYAFVRKNSYTKPMLKEKARKVEFDDLAEKIVKDFAHNQDYREGDARRFIGGLFVADKIDLSERTKEARTHFQTSEMTGGYADYLITRYGEVEAIVQNAIDRIAYGKTKKSMNSADSELCASIKEGKLNLSSRSEVTHLARVLRAHLTETERKKMINRATDKVLLKDQGVDKIFSLYIANERDALTEKYS